MVGLIDWEDGDLNSHCKGMETMAVRVGDGINIKRAGSYLVSM